MKKVVFVDDSKTMLMLANVAVKPLIENGEIAISKYDNPIDLLQDLQDGNLTFDLLVTDINMPQMNGFELIEKIKDIGVDGSVKFVALTTEGTEEKKELIKKAGFMAWIMKPVQTDILRKAIEKILSRE